MHNLASWVVSGGPLGPASIRINGENRGSETLYSIEFWNNIFLAITKKGKLVFCLLFASIYMNNFVKSNFFLECGLIIFKKKDNYCLLLTSKYQLVHYAIKYNQILNLPLSRKCEFSFCTLPVPARGAPSPPWCPSRRGPSAPSAG